MEAADLFDRTLESIKLEINEDVCSKKWQETFRFLKRLIRECLFQHLEIEIIPCTRGDKFDDKLHKPYLMAEPDKELANNTIKQIVFAGFQYKPENTNNGENQDIIVKPVDVIVVKNS